MSTPNTFKQRFAVRLKSILRRYDENQKTLEQLATAGTPEQLATCAQEQSVLQPVVQAILIYQETQQTIEDLITLGEADATLKEEALREIECLKDKLPTLEKEIQLLLLPKDKADSKDVIIEIRQGTGGGEAALFAADLWNMYTRYAEKKGWQTQLMSLNRTDLKGVKEVIFSLKGKDAFAHLKFESGIHRIQRVPETEAGGRIHTSAATVAVLPEAEDIDVQLHDDDLRIDTYRASGAGGQHVNKTESAVRITHLPTGLVVQQQDEKSQHKNKARAMKILRARLYEKQRHDAEAARSSVRKDQIGSGDRSGRIRTYNALQGRVTDHRINLTLHQYEAILGGNLDTLIEALRAHCQEEQLSEINA